MAKIIGNTTVTPMPRSDFAQNDPTKADYIKNKPTTLSGYGITDSYTKPEIDGMFSAKIEAKIENNILVIDDMLSAKIEAKIENNILVVE